MRQKLIPCFLAAAVAFTGAFGASLITADPSFAAVTGDKVKVDGRVATRAEYRNNANFGGGGVSSTHNFIVQNTQLGITHDITPDLGYRILMQDSRVWGGQTTLTTNTGGTGAPAGAIGFNTVGGIHGTSFGIREGYIVVRNIVVPGLNTKIGRQKLVLGNQRILGHFDWSNVGWSFDGVRFDYASSAKTSHILGWFRMADDDCGNPTSLCQAGSGATGAKDSDFILFYNTIKSIPKHTIEPYWIWVMDERTNTGASTTSTGRLQADQQRHMLGVRVNGKPGIVDYTLEYVYQTGRQENGGQPGANRRTISAQALAANVGVSLPVPMKPRIAFEFDYATGSGQNGAATGGRTTFENFWPTNHLHYGYMDLMGWKNMMSFGPQFSVKPSANGTFKVHFWWHRLADADGHWYNAGQGRQATTRLGNSINEIGQELNIVYVHKLFGGASTVNMGYGHFFTGSYIDKSKSSSCSSCGSAGLTDNDDQDWAYIWWITKF